jgi:hypothetical protein
VEGTVVRRLIATSAPLAVAIPGAIIGVATWIAVVLAAAGADPFWRVEPVNLSEAAALRDRATVVQLMASGEDPYAPREIRPDVLFNNAVTLTPVEAGIAAGRAEVVDVILFSAHTPPDAPTWNRIRCLAQLQGDEDVEAVLDRYRPASAVLECSGVTRPWK